MPILDILTFQVGPAVAKAILRLWLLPEEALPELGVELIDILKAKTSDVLAQRNGVRQFEAIGDKVVSNLLPLFQSESFGQDEGSRSAVALAVATTLNSANIDPSVLAKLNLEPTKLEKHLLMLKPNTTQEFSTSETSFYRRVISEVSRVIVDIASQLPTFTERTFSEILRREDQLLSTANQILEEIKRIRGGNQHLEIESFQFENDYRSAVIRNLDRLELFGLDVSTISRRQRLSVAYVTLSVEHKKLAITTKDKEVENHEESENLITTSSVNRALSNSHRLLIRSLAGSGKTTLLQWIAVRSASKDFPDELSKWNKTIPFLIRLRQCVSDKLPPPEDFPRLVAPLIADTMPHGWVHNQLKLGRGLLLVDGIDEVPESRRIDVYHWLLELVTSFPQSHFVVTSRPHAVNERWLSALEFDHAEIQPMELLAINEFVDHWHNAIKEEVIDKEEAMELNSLCANLKIVLRRNLPLRNLATSPLLCAMLCALHRDRRKQLPSDRIELYEAACYMLLERRDIERHIQLAEYPVLTYRQKRVLLQDVAYWMLTNNWSEVVSNRVIERLSKRLLVMEGASKAYQGQDVYRFFVERSGIMREPLIGQVDFTHRTFQEYLAAQAALDEDNIGVLLENAENDQWREVIILAAGLARPKERDELIEGLITKGDKRAKKIKKAPHGYENTIDNQFIDEESYFRFSANKRLGGLLTSDELNNQFTVDDEKLEIYLHKEEASRRIKKPNSYHRLYLLAVACLETAVEMSADVRAKVQQRLVKIVPPQAFDEAQTLASAGDSIIPYLHFKPSLNENTASSCIRTLTIIGGSKAFEALVGYAMDTRPKVIDELLRGWDVFDRDEFAQKILISVVSHTPHLIIDRVSTFEGFEHLTSLTRLIVRDCREITDINSLSKLTNLEWLTLHRCNNLIDIAPLARLSKLRGLDLEGATKLTDITPLSNLKDLSRLDLKYCTSIQDVSILLDLKKLRTVSLQGVPSRVREIWEISRKN